MDNKFYIWWILGPFLFALAFIGVYIFCFEEIIEQNNINKHLEEMQVNDGQGNKKSESVDRQEDGLSP
jgi:hypothetical protein